MSLPPPQTQEFVDRLTSLAVECREELTRGTQAIQEIDLLLRQTQQEIDRLSQRESQQANRLRDMESSLESFSRTEIRESYVTTHEVQLRLFMMRSQIEQLEARRDSLINQQEKLRILLDLAEFNRDNSEVEVPGDDRTKILPGTQVLAGNVDLASEIIEAREVERERMARQLADGPAQVLANVILRTQILERVAERAPDALSDEIKELEGLASRSLMDVRRAIFEMRPLVIDELGVVATVRRYANDFARENGATITIEGADRDADLDEHARIILFRLIQQAMIVLVSPGVGTQLHISVRFEESQLLARLDATSVGAGTAQKVGQFVADHYTLDTLDLIGGTVQRESISGGERISFVIPLGGI